MDEYNSFVGTKHLVKTEEEVFANIKRFNEDLSKSEYLITNLSRFKDWYYDSMRNQFGPKKFIGFKNMTAEKYEALKKNPHTNRGGNFDSYIAAPILDKLSVRVEEDRKNSLLDELKLFLSEYDSHPRKKMEIHIIR